MCFILHIRKQTSIVGPSICHTVLRNSEWRYTSKDPKRFPRIQNRSQNPKHIPESGFWKVFLNSGTCFGFREVFWILGSILCSGKCFWILGRVFGFWEVFLDSGTCFWILGRVLDSGKCFWILGSVLESGKCFVLTSHRREVLVISCGKHASFSI